MRLLSSHAITVVWLMLVAATAISWWLGTDHSGARDPSQATVSIIVLAMMKVRLVILYFMEIRTAPLALRLLCEAWVVVVCSALLGLYLLR